MYSSSQTFTRYNSSGMIYCHQKCDLNVAAMCSNIYKSKLKIPDPTIYLSGSNGTET